jgi:hypothetical protein
MFPNVLSAFCGYLTEASSFVAYEIKVESISYQSVVELHTLAILSSLKVFEENFKIS